MTGATVRFLAQRRTAILDAALDGLAGARAPHYAGTDAHEARVRFERLFDGVVDAVATRDVSSLLELVRRLADERYEAGYDLGELQTAFNVLEEAIWRRLLEDFPPSPCADALGTVSTALALAKDALARRYVDLVAERRARALDVGALFAGTERG
jgi:hypothetical protein